MVMIVCPFPPWHLGGVETLVKNTSILLNNQPDINVKILCTSPSGKVGKSNWNNIPVSVYRSYTQSLYYFSPGLLSALKKSNSDIIHAHSLNTFIPLACALTKKNRPIVLQPHYHPIGSTQFNKMLKKMYDPIFIRYVFDKTDAIICVSNYEKDQLIQNLNVSEDKIHVIPSGIDLNTIRKSEPYDSTKKLILFVGRIEKYKNIEHTVKAMEYLSDDYHFYIIGHGAYKLELERMINNLKLEKRVKILTNLDTSEVYRWMKTADLFITLSDIEAFGLTVIEALAAGTPVIVNDKTALSEFPVKFQNEVFPVNLAKTTPEALADHIKSRRVNEVKVNLDMYTWENIVINFKKVYNKIEPQI
jgi:glycosyltransferase involved in cell wall biosynthesis